MKRKDFYLIAQPLVPKLYRFAHALIPDDLQAEQLVIDGMNAFILNEQKKISNREVDVEDKKEQMVLGRMYFRGILQHMASIGARRSGQLLEQMKVSIPENYTSFYSLESKIRAAIYLRYEAQLSVDEIEDVLQIPRFEVIEKIHNGRFLLLNDLNKGMRI